MENNKEETYEERARRIMETDYSIYNDYETFEKLSDEDKVKIWKEIQDKKENGSIWKDKIEEASINEAKTQEQLMEEGVLTFLNDHLKRLGFKTKVLSLLNTKRPNDASELLTKKILELFNIYTTRDDIKSEMWVYSSGIYVPQGKSFIKEFLRLILNENYKDSIVNNVLDKIEADTYIEHDAFFKTNYISEIPVENGILNIFTRKLTPCTPKKIFFNKLPIRYNPEANCPNIINHFQNVLKDTNDSIVLFELFGFLLLKEYKIEKAGMFVGKGRNGKSKTLELMKRFLGATNCSSLPLSMMKTESFCISELFGKMANLSGDLSNTDLKETGVIKMLIGRDTIQAKRKFLRDLNFVNYAKLLFAANELPKVYDMSDGFWTKWVLLEFPYKFIPKEEYEKLKQEDVGNQKPMNPDIIQTLTTEEELSGLLNMALDGLDRLLKQEDFSYTKGTQEVKELWIRQSDSFMSFCLDCLEASTNENITKKELRKYYHKYCQKHKVRGASDIGIKATLQSMFGADEGQKTIIIDATNKITDRERIWEGIKFKENYEEKL